MIYVLELSYIVPDNISLPLENKTHNVFDITMKIFYITVNFPINKHEISDTIEIVQINLSSI